MTTTYVRGESENKINNINSFNSAMDRPNELLFSSIEKHVSEQENNMKNEQPQTLFNLKTKKNELLMKATESLPTPISALPSSVPHQLSPEIISEQEQHESFPNNSSTSSFADVLVSFSSYSTIPNIPNEKILSYQAEPLSSSSLPGNKIDQSLDNKNKKFDINGSTSELTNRQATKELKCEINSLESNQEDDNNNEEFSASPTSMVASISQKNNLKINIFNNHATTASSLVSPLKTHPALISDWRCIQCGVNETQTPLKRKGPDGQRNLCNACYVRFRVKMERAERGTARPILPIDGGVVLPLRPNMVPHSIGNIGTSIVMKRKTSTCSSTHKINSTPKKKGKEVNKKEEKPRKVGRKSKKNKNDKTHVETQNQYHSPAMAMPLPQHQHPGSMNPMHLMGIHPEAPLTGVPKYSNKINNDNTNISHSNRHYFDPSSQIHLSKQYHSDNNIYNSQYHHHDTNSSPDASNYSLAPPALFLPSMSDASPEFIYDNPVSSFAYSPGIEYHVPPKTVDNGGLTLNLGYEMNAHEAAAAALMAPYWQESTSLPLNHHQLSSALPQQNVIDPSHQFSAQTLLSSNQTISPSNIHPNNNVTMHPSLVQDPSSDLYNNQGIYRDQSNPEFYQNINNNSKLNHNFSVHPTTSSFEYNIYPSSQHPQTSEEFVNLSQMTNDPNVFGDEYYSLTKEVGINGNNSNEEDLTGIEFVNEDYADDNTAKHSNTRITH